MFTVHRKELIDQITSTFAAEGINLNHCTIMTVGKIAHRLGKLPKPSLIITDETHHSLAKTYRKIYDYYSDVPRLGFSATPWRMSGQGLSDVYDDMVEGPSVKWLIENSFLAPFDYYAPTLIDIDRLKKSSTGDYSNKSIDQATEKVIFGDVVKHYQKLADGQQAIVYCHSIEASKRVVKSFNEAGINAQHADSKTPKEQRDKIMAEFKDGSLKILSNVDLISEGFNVPDCGVVIMLRPTASLVLDVQQSMRGMRYKPNKRSIIIDHVGNVYRFGLPDTDRHWSLTGSGKKSHNNSNDDAPAIRTCPNCYAVIPGESKICPLCGFEQPVQSVKMKNDKDTKLQKIEEFKLVAEEPCTMEPNEAKSYSDLAKIAHSRGYKRGWVFYQAKLRGFIKGAK